MINSYDNLLNPANEEKLLLSNSIFRAVKNIYNSKELVSPHYHPELELILPKNLYGYSYIDGRKFKFEDNGLHLIPPSSIHAFKIESLKTNNYIIALQIRLSSLLPVISEISGLDSNSILKEIKARKIIQNNLREPLEKLILSLSIFNSEKIKDRLVRSTNDLEIIIRIISTLFKGESIDLPENKGKPTNLLERVIKVIEEEYYKEISLEEIANKCFVSKFHLSRVFKEKSGMTIWNYIHKFRINRAQYLLMEENLNVSEASEKCGFKNTSHFINVFSKFTNSTPKQWLMQKSKSD